MTAYADKMIASFPEGMIVPSELIAFYRWLDTQQLYQNFDGEGYPHALIDPTQSQSQSQIYAILADVEHAKAWVDSDNPAIYNRLAPFFRLGGDGTYAALWRNDAGDTQIVVLGSGSGSTMMGILTDNAVDFLRLIAIGYQELSFPEQHALTPAEIYEEEYEDYDEDEDREEAAQPPLALQQWVSSTFNTSIPERASDILGEIADMDSDSSDDPFWLWDHSLDKWK